MKYDIFISHASEDKDTVALPLANMLADQGVRVWIDKEQIRLGDSLRKTIGEGLKESRFGLLILSPSFFQKEWPQRELDALLSRDISEGKVILPVRHNLSADEVRSYSPLLADKVSISTSTGLVQIVKEIKNVLEISTPSNESSQDEEQPKPEYPDIEILHKKKTEVANFRLRSGTLEYSVSPENAYDVKITGRGVNYPKRNYLGGGMDDLIMEEKRDAFIGGIDKSVYWRDIVKNQFNPIILEIVVDIPDLSVNVDDKQRFVNVEIYPTHAIPIVPSKDGTSLNQNLLNFSRGIFTEYDGAWFVSSQEKSWVVSQIDTLPLMRQYAISSDRQDLIRRREDREKIDTIFHLFIITPKGSALEKPDSQILITLTLEGSRYKPITQSWSLPSVWAK